jgi:hypothetical protein
VPPVLIGILPRFAAPTLRHPGYVSAPLTTPGLRSGTPVRSSFVAEPPHCAFPTFGRSDPAPNDGARQSPRFVSFSAGRHRAAGLVHAAGIRPAVPSASARSTHSGGFLPKIATHFVCVAIFANAPDRARSVAHGRHPAEERGGLRVRRNRERCLKRRTGSDGLQVRLNGTPFCRRFRTR